MRTWLYRICTNVCLRALENRARRPLPSGLGAPDTLDAPLAAARPEVPWLEPLPDTALRAGPGAPGDPASIVVSRQSVRLALVAALQHLPPRQRAVLILRDVLGWPAAEVAGLLQMSVIAVNSALRRARDGLRQAGVGEDDVREPTDAGTRAIVDQYATAFENADVAALTRLLAADAVLEMPPTPTWFAGREAVARFLGTRVLGAPGDFLLTGTGANGQPAFAAYLREPDDVFRAHAIQVLTVSGGLVSRIVSFNDGRLLRPFGFPAELAVGSAGPADAAGGLGAARDAGPVARRP